MRIGNKRNVIQYSSNNFSLCDILNLFINFLIKIDLRVKGTRQLRIVFFLSKLAFQLLQAVITTHKSFFNLWQNWKGIFH
jgi:hypothetical protein